MSRLLYCCLWSGLCASGLLLSGEARADTPANLRGKAKTSVVKVGNFGSDKMLNPQPLPPREVMNLSVFSRVNWVLLNPQPLPPRWNLGVLRGLNPQPLPPRR